MFSILSPFLQVNILPLPRTDILILSSLPQINILFLSRTDIFILSFLLQPDILLLFQPDISNNKVEMQYCTRCKTERPRN